MLLDTKMPLSGTLTASSCAGVGLLRASANGPDKGTIVNQPYPNFGLLEPTHFLVRTIILPYFRFLVKRQLSQFELRPRRVIGLQGQPCSFLVVRWRLDNVLILSSQPGL